MMFDPKDNSLKITTKEAARAGKDLLAAIHYFRKAAGLPLEGGSRSAASDTCEYCILRAATNLGIDLGANTPGKLDVREYR